jgi:Skp family chaperone for outer membrane proteins
MKKLIVMLMVAGLFGATPLLAAESHEHGKNDAAACVIQCAQQSETLQGKIEKIKSEIAKGNKDYTAEELQALEKKLKEANDFLDAMGKN